MKRPVEVSIKCSDCNKPETIEADGCIVICFRGSQYAVARHHVEDIDFIFAIKSLASNLIDDIKRENKNGD